MTRRCSGATWRPDLVVLIAGILAVTTICRVDGQEGDLLQCQEGWFQHGVHCYRFFNIRHSWKSAAGLCRRYGSDLVLISDFSQNNFTSALSSSALRDSAQRTYWIGLTAIDNLSTNTLESASGSFVSKYVGFWDLDQPRVTNGRCVRAKSTSHMQVWELAPCEMLLPFMCQRQACPKGSMPCNNGRCVNSNWHCDGEDDCGDKSDEINCPKLCNFYMQSSGDSIQSPNYPLKYISNSDCKWTLEGPIGTGIVLQFSEFDTESNFDTVQILAGGRTEESSVSLVTLSGTPNITSRTFTTATNLMIIKFRSDASVEKRGFRASWKTEPIKCGGELFAQPSAQVLTSPQYPESYPGGLECVYIITAPQGKIVTLEFVEFDLEPDKDFILVRDGASPSDPLLARMTGPASSNLRFVISTGNRIYLYFQTSFGDSRKGFSIRFRAGCEVEAVASSGNITSPAFGIHDYPSSQLCTYRVTRPNGGSLSLKFTDFSVAKDDFVQVYDGPDSVNGVRLHPGQGFTGSTKPSLTLTASSGQMFLTFESNPLNTAEGWKASFSADCPPLRAGMNAVASSRETAFGSKVTFSCPLGQEFSNGEVLILTECLQGGKWSVSHIPSCQERYCGPVPQIDNGFAVAATNVTYRGTATYQCYAGFAFPSGSATESIRCTEEGRWEKLPVCLASSCPPLPETPHAVPILLNGGGRSYGTIIRFECDPGYHRTGLPVIVCTSNGFWSGPPPNCDRARCPILPEIENGYITDAFKDYFYDDEAKVQCHRGFRLEGNSIIKCGPNQTFTDLPKCIDIDECSSPSCDTASTECTNTAGGFFCKCKTGFEPNLDCRPVGDLGLSIGTIPDISIKVSGSEAGYNKNMVRLDNVGGWCGNIPRAGENWIQIDMRAPTIIRGFRTQPVQRIDGSMAYPVTVAIQYTDDLTDIFRDYTDQSGRPVQFRIAPNGGSSLSVINLPIPLETRYVRLVIMEYAVSPCLRLELMGCSRQDCLDINECLDKNGGCDQRCINGPGSVSCLCNVGFELYAENGTSGFYIPPSETGLKDGDVYRINKTCVPKMCPALSSPQNGLLLSTKDMYHFGDIVHFQCSFGYVMVGSPTLLCTSNGVWNGTVPECRYASCVPLADDAAQGLHVEYNGEDNFIPFLENATISCAEVGRPLRNTASSYFRQCVYDPQDSRGDFWLSGAPPACPRIDCGTPPDTAGATYGFYVDTKYRASFYFGCEETFTLGGKTLKNDNVIRCQEDGTWDFGDLRCEGPVCQDPGRPPDGVQIAASYEQGSEVSFSCNKPGYIPYSTDPITCVKNAECTVVKPLGLTSGLIPDHAINATSQRSNYEAKHVRLNSATGWCGQQEAFTYVTVDLGKVYRIKAILVKGVITSDVVGRPTELRLFYKVQEVDNFVVYFPNFNLTSREPGNFGELTVIPLPISIQARYIILGIVSYNKNPCLKFELMGCEDAAEKVLLGYDQGYPVCVDQEPPQFINCPTKPIVVSKSLSGLLPANFTIPVAVDNSGRVARFEVRPPGFRPPMMLFEDMTVEYLAYDFDGNVAVCTINITIPDDVPPSLTCPPSYVVELVEQQDSYQVNFNETRKLINATDKSGEVEVTIIPETALIPVGGYRNVTVLAEDRFGNQASCHFQVSVQAASCVSWSLAAPANGMVKCLPNDESTGYRCLATCSNGFKFTDGDAAKTYECANKQPWTPSSIVPDCVPEDTSQAAYDVVAEIEYRAGGFLSPPCLGHYVSYVSTYYGSLNQVLSERCSAINVNMEITFHNTTVRAHGDNELYLSYTLRVAPALRQQLLYDLCGSTLSLIFDLSVPNAYAIIDPLLNITAQQVGGGCPGIQAVRSSVTRGFTCEDGEVLNVGGAGQVPRCLHCPAGTFASKIGSCTFCPSGFYQDLTRQSICRRCPEGTHTRHSGSKSLSECVPVCGYGTYSPTGLVPCLQCPAHTFSGPPPKDGFRECQRCPANTFTYTPGATISSECKARCPPGTYSDTGLEPCAPCPVNFYQTEEGKTSCTECASNHRTLRPGALSPEACTPVKCSGISCQHGGICIIQNHRGTCYCPAGFTGQLCEVDIDECASRPCYNGGTCIDLPQGYSCRCPPGYSGLQCQLERSDCLNNTCPERAMCQDLPGVGNVNCLCRSGYEGPTCNVTVNPCTSGNNPCENNGVCIPLQQGRYKCECPPGWTGRKCEVDIDDCTEQPCLLGANCTDLINDFQCDCPPGFAGKRCHLKIDLCATSPCANGICVDHLYYYKCICSPGWTGPSCDVNIDDCANDPCANEGECIDLINGFRCQCDAGFTGSRCQHPIDSCEESPCQNGGTCYDLIDGFVCQCRPGYVGLQCEAEVDECVSSPCYAPGTKHCIDLDNTFQCECNQGFRGERCEININECLSGPCLNGGTCTDDVNGYKCRCPPGWTGERCEVDLGACDSSPCLNDATCVDLFLDYFCVCPSGTDGKRCQTSPKRCIGNPCMRGGMCKDYGSGLNCTCQEKYSGIGCQYEYDPCETNACQNGATCVDTGEDYMCVCPQGFMGRHCDEDVPDCTASSCPPTATCIDLTNGFYCKCPFNLTGEDCRKTINIDYDLYINDESRSSSVSLAAPFDLGSSSLTIAMWIQYSNPDSPGAFFSLYSVKSPHLPIGKRPLIQMDYTGAMISFFPELDDMFVPFLENVPVNDGQWHYIVVTWDGTKGTLMLVTDTAVAGAVNDYATNMTLPLYGWISLGAPQNGENKATAGAGFHGRISRVNVWDRPLDMTSEIPSQFRNCKSAPVLYSGLLLRWTGYDRVDGTVEREGPGTCGQRVCPVGYVGDDCRILEQDKSAPRVSYCPPTMWVISPNTSTVVHWDEPKFTDDLLSLRVSERNGLQPGQTLMRGTYDITYIASDDAGNTARCDFRIHVLNEFCPLPMPPIGGQRRCTEWGPHGRFKVCNIKCDDGLEFSQPVAEFYVCDAEGFWRPTDYPGKMLVFPACAPKKAAQRIFRIAMNFPSSVVCSDSGKKILHSRIMDGLLQVNRAWRVCADPTQGSCKGLKVNVKCSKQGRVVRQAENNDVYVVEVSFPANNDPVTNINTQEKSTIQSVVQMAVLQNSMFDVRDTLPNVTPDLTSLDMVTDYECPPGQVVVAPNCVQCSLGTYYENVTKTCNSCPVGTYQNELGQLMCKACPTIAGRKGVTGSVGARSPNECKERCSAGKYYDESVGLCRPCGYGYYQPQEGAFGCIHCGPGLTTRNVEALSAQECREECEAGLQLNAAGICEPCPRGTYRTRGMPSCESCPPGKTTASMGALSRELCSLEVCNPGQFLNATLDRCTPCPRGTYQDREQRETECLPCPPDTTTGSFGSTSVDACTNPCVVNGQMRDCKANAFCVFLEDSGDYDCDCKPQYRPDENTGECVYVCDEYCENGGKCEVNLETNRPKCECLSNFYGDKCEKKSEFVYIAGGIAGAVIFIILLVLLIWMICVRTTVKNKPKKMPQPSVIDLSGASTNFYYGAPAPYAESIAPSHHSTYAHYYDDDDDGWEMPNFYNETYMKESLHNGKNGGNSLGHSNPSIYGNKEDLYDRLRRHQYQGKKGDTTSDSEDQGQ